MISNAFPLSYFQQFMAHNTLKGKDGTGCCVCQILMDLNCEMDITAFEHAWAKTVLHYEQLRLGFWKDKDQLNQFITDYDETNITYHDWSDSKITKTDEWIETFLKSDRRLGFSLFNPPLFRLVLFKLSPRKYRFLFSYHNVIADYTCIRLILRSLFVFYQYPDSDIIPPCWFRRQIETLSIGKYHPEAEKFWKTYLNQSSSPSTIPSPGSKKTPESDNRSPLALTLTSAEFTQRFTIKITQGLSTNDLKMDTEHEVLFFAVWILILSHHTGKPDLLTGIITPISAPPATNDTDGCPPQRNILPIRISIDPEEHFSQLLSRIKNHLGRIRKFGHCTMMDIHAWAGLNPKDCWRYALFSIIPSGLKSAAGEAFKNLGGTTLSFVEWVPSPLYLAVCGTGSISVTLKYDRRLYSQQRIETLITHFSNVMGIVSQGSDPVLKDIPVTHYSHPPHDLNNRFFNGSLEKPGSLIHHLIDIRAAAEKDNMAILDTHRKISYSLLLEKAEYIAYHLKSLGSGPGKRILILVQPDGDMAASLLGIFKSGGICIFCPPSLNSLQTINKFIRQTSPDMIIAQPRYHENLLKNFEKKLPPVFYFDTQEKEWELPNEAVTEQNLTPEDTAVMLFSEKESGNYTAVEISHSALLAKIYAMSDVLSFQPGGRILTLDFPDRGMLAIDILMSLFNGTEIVIPPANFLESDQSLMTFCRQMEITVLQIHPSLLKTIIKQIKQNGFPESIRLIILHDELSDSKGLSEIQQHVPESCRLIVTFGPAETTFGAAWKELSYSPGTPLNYDINSEIGNPFPGIQLCVLNHFLQPALSGTTGELFIGGLQIAKGYYQQKELSEKKFVTLEHESADTRFYRTEYPVTRNFSGHLFFQKNNDSDLSDETPDKTVSRPFPIILVGNSVKAARSYQTVDLKGHPFFHAPIFVHYYAKPRHQRLSIDVPQLAAACRKDMLQKYPEGPYIIIGECQNAVVAHEMAVQLEHRGKLVSLLVIIDENWHDDKNSMHVSAPSENSTPFLKRQIDRLQMHGISYLLAKILERMKNIILRRVYALDPFRNKLYSALNLTAPHSLQFRIMENVFYQACDKNPYEPPPYDKPVLLLYSRQWETLHHPMLNQFYTGHVEKKKFDIAHSEWFEPEQINSILKEIHKIL